MAFYDEVGMNRALLLIAGWIGRASAAWLATLRRPLAAEVAGLRNENERLRAENELLRARLWRLDAHARPRYKSWERLAILWHRARHGLSLEGTAKAFVVCAHTIENWIAEVEKGVVHLVRAREPLNKLRDLVREIAARVKAQWPRWGSRRIAGILARLGLKASRSSVQRMLRRPAPRPAKLLRAARGNLVAKEPDHIWLIDFSVVRNVLRSVVIGAILDAFSRKILALRVSATEPDAAFACRLVAEATQRYGRKPRSMITDQGPQFKSKRFVRFLSKTKIRHRYGAVGRKGSISLIERMWRSLKEEALPRFFLFMPVRCIEKRLARWARWHDTERPHTGLGLRTPDEVHRSMRRHPLRRVECGVLEVRFVDDNRSLPIFRLRRAS